MIKGTRPRVCGL